MTLACPLSSSPANLAFDSFTPITLSSLLLLLKTSFSPLSYCICMVSAWKAPTLSLCMAVPIVPVSA